MNVFLCIDDNNGILFNHRRVSRDRVLCQWIMDQLQGKKFFLREYSKELFSEYAALEVSEDYLKKAGKDDFCFVEDDGYSPYLNETEHLFLCKWNRRYPSDVKFERNRLDNSWTLFHVEEFPGSSHEKITVEEWIRNEKN